MDKAYDRLKQSTDEQGQISVDQLKTELPKLNDELNNKNIPGLISVLNSTFSVLGKLNPTRTTPPLRSICEQYERMMNKLKDVQNEVAVAIPLIQNYFKIISYECLAEPDHQPDTTPPTKN